MTDKLHFSRIFALCQCPSSILTVIFAILHDKHSDACSRLPRPDRPAPFQMPGVETSGAIHYIFNVGGSNPKSPLQTEQLMNMPTLMTNALKEKLGAEHVVIEDETWKHAGHKGAMNGFGHYRLTVVSPAFEGKSPIERHRMIYELFADEMKTKIHALTMKTFAPDEWAAAKVS